MGCNKMDKNSCLTYFDGYIDFVDYQDLIVIPNIDFLIKKIINSIFGNVSNEEVKNHPMRDDQEIDVYVFAIHTMDVLRSEYIDTDIFQSPCLDLPPTITPNHNEFNRTNNRESRRHDQQYLDSKYKRRRKNDKKYY